MPIFLFHLHLHFSNSYVCEQLYARTPPPTYIYVYLQIYLHISTLMYMDPSILFLCICIPILVCTYWPVLGHMYNPVSIPLLLLIPMSLFQYPSVFIFPVRALHTYLYSSAWIYLPFLYAPFRTYFYTCAFETSVLSLFHETSHVSISIIMGIYVLLLPCQSVSMYHAAKLRVSFFLSFFLSFERES